MKPLIDLHCHTIASGHAYSTIKENIEAASLAGLKAVGISDHAPGMAGRPVLAHFLNLKSLKPMIEGVQVFIGAEADIVDYEGTINMPDRALYMLDYIIASLHSACIEPKSAEENTQAVLGAIKNPYVKIIGHPDDGRFCLDYDRIVCAAKENNVLIEINNWSVNPVDSRQGNPENQRTIIRLCKKYGAKIILSSDAHVYYEIGDFTYSLKLLEEEKFPEELVSNCDLKSFEGWMRRRSSFS